MKLQRILQTTLVHPLRAEFSATALFVPSDFSENVDIAALLRALGMESLSGGSISESELKRIIACTLRNTLEVFDMDDKEFTLFVNTSDIHTEFLENMIYNKSILVERFRPEAESCIALLNNSYAAALGLYSAPGPKQIGGTSDSRKFPFLVLVMPYGILICGNTRGIYGALHLGLYEGIYTSFLGESFEPTPSRIAALQPESSRSRSDFSS